MTDDAPKKRHYCSACDCIHEDGKCLAPPDAQPDVTLNRMGLSPQPEAGEEIVLHRLTKASMRRVSFTDNPWEECIRGLLHHTNTDYEHAVATLRRKP